MCFAGMCAHPLVGATGNGHEMSVECLVRSKDLVGESPLWQPEHECLYWTDINGFKIHRYSFETREVKSWRFEVPVTTLSLTTDAEWLLVALGPRLILWSPARDTRMPFAQPELDWPHNRLNDGATDPNGIFWAGSMRNNVGEDGSDLDVEGRTGSLYRVNAHGETAVVDTGFGITNTVAWSPDRSTFYCGCSIQNVIYAYDYDGRDSSLSNRRVFVQGLPQGVPDGSAMDEEGCLWNARFFGGCILRISPAGKVVEEIRMPVSNVTNCGFGGHDLRTLFVTTASLHGGEAEELAGGLFTMRTDVRGMETGRFRWTASRISSSG
jgi:sugar lactone lactonase YvrE